MVSRTCPNYGNKMTDLNRNYYEFFKYKKQLNQLNYENLKNIKSNKEKECILLIIGFYCLKKSNYLITKL